MVSFPDQGSIQQIPWFVSVQPRGISTKTVKETANSETHDLPNKCNDYQGVTYPRLEEPTPGIADYVQNLVYRPKIPNFEDDDVPRIVERFHRVQFLRLYWGG